MCGIKHKPLLGPLCLQTAEFLKCRTKHPQKQFIDFCVYAKICFISVFPWISVLENSRITWSRYCLPMWGLNSLDGAAFPPVFPLSIPHHPLSSRIWGAAVALIYCAAFGVWEPLELQPGVLHQPPLWHQWLLPSMGDKWDLAAPAQPRGMPRSQEDQSGIFAQQGKLQQDTEHLLPCRMRSALSPCSVWGMSEITSAVQRGKLKER